MIGKSLRMITKRALTPCHFHTGQDWREYSNVVIQSLVMAKGTEESREDTRSGKDEVKKKAS